MSSKEECDSELEVLSSIYEDKLMLLKKKYPQTFVVMLDAHTSSKSDLDLKCKIKFSYNESYPNVAPMYEIINTVNIRDSHIAMFVQLLNETAASSLGYMMVYDMISKVQEKLNDIAEAWQDDINQEEERVKKQKEEEEEAKFHGTKLTVENFMSWKKAFLEEMEKNLTDKEKRERAIELEMSTRMTGKALFLKDNRFDDSDIKFLEEGDDIEVDEKLFDNIDGLHLDSLSDEDYNSPIDVN